MATGNSGKGRDDGMRPVPNVAALLRLAESYGVADDENVQKLIWAVQRTGNARLAEKARRHIERLGTKRALSGDPFPPPVTAEEAWGPFEIGVVENSGQPFGLRPEELVQHTYEPGRSGSGKTTAMLRLCREVIQTGASMQPEPHLLVFDIKGDYGVLGQEFSGVLELKVPGPHCRINFLEPPPGCSCHEWAGIFAEAFANAAGLYQAHGSENFLFKALLELYALYDTENDRYPSLLDLLDYLDALRRNKAIQRNSDEYHWFTRVRERVESYVAALGDTVDCSRGFDLSEILTRHTVIDMTSLRGSAQSLFTEVLLKMVLTYRRVTGERHGVLRTLAMFDEAARLLPKYREHTGQGSHKYQRYHRDVARVRDRACGGGL